MNIYYKLEDFKALNIDINEYQEREIIKAKELAEEVSVFHPSTMLVEVEKCGNDKFYKHPHVFLNLPDAEYKVTVRYLSYRGNYMIGAYKNFGNMEYITPNDKNKNDLTNTLNNIGKLSAKKIQDYLNAIDQTYKTLTQLSSERVKAVEDFKKKLEGLPVSWWRDGTAGSVKRGGLEYQFAVEPNGYISQKIIVDQSANLDSFLKMSDNKL